MQPTIADEQANSPIYMGRKKLEDSPESFDWLYPCDKGSTCQSLMRIESFKYWYKHTGFAFYEDFTGHDIRVQEQPRLIYKNGHPKYFECLHTHRYIACLGCGMPASEKQADIANKLLGNKPPEIDDDFLGFLLDR